MTSFVGRDLELGRMLERLESAQRGRGGLITLCGEAGIGKTRLAEELAGRAETLGISVFRGRCWESGGAPAYWPWTQILEGLGRSGALDVSALASVELGGLLPRSAAAGVPEPDCVAEDPERARFALYQSVLELLRQASETKPILLVIDDLHAADLSSLSLLLFIARALHGESILFLSMFRDTDVRHSEHGGALVAQIVSEGETFPLRRLKRAEVDRLLEETGIETSPELTDRVFERPEGNPLFVHEVSRLLQSRVISDPDHVLPRSLTVKETIRQRLGLVDPSCREILSVAAAIGKEFSLTLLGEVLGELAQPLAQALGPCLRSGILIQHGVDRYAFSHTLIREAAYEAHPLSARCEIHARVADALVATAAHPDTRTKVAAEEAHHRLLAGASQRERAISSIVAAAGAAADLCASEDALVLLERGHRSLGPVSIDNRHLVCELYLAEGRTAIRCGQQERGTRACHRAIEIARSARDHQRLARGVLTLGSEFNPGVTSRELVGLLEECRQNISDADAALRARLLARLAAALQPAEDAGEPIALAREAIHLSRRSGDQAVIVEVLSVACAAFFEYVDPRELEPILEELYSHYSLVRDRRALARINRLWAFTHLALGRRSEAEARIAEHAELALALGLPRLQWLRPSLQAVLASLDGDCDRAMQLIAEAETLAQGAGFDETRRLSVQRMMTLWANERYQDAAELFPVFARALTVIGAGSGRSRERCLAFEASLHARSGNDDQARRDVALLPEDPPAIFSEPWVWLWLAEVYAAIGETGSVAQGTYELLLPRSGHFGSWGTVFATLGPVDRCLALLADRLGDWAGEERFFERALQQCTVMGARIVLARTQVEFAEALVRHGEPKRAAQVLEPAMAVARELGLDALVKRAPPSGVEPGPSPNAARFPRFAIDRDGEHWRISREGRTFLVKNSRGIRILKKLIDEPDREVHVLDLADSGAAGTIDAGDSGEILDRAAREALRGRVRELRLDLAEAESHNDLGRIEKLRTETDAITAELTAALGLGGRGRRGSRAAERARSAVQRRVRAAIQRIAKEDAVLGQHLDATLKTGAFCVYHPCGRPLR